MMDDEKRTIPQLETEEAFIKTINSEGVHVVEFVAGWCRKCKTLNGKMEYFAVEHPEVTFDKIDVNMVPQDFHQIAKRDEDADGEDFREREERVRESRV